MNIASQNILTKIVSNVDQYFIFSYSELGFSNPINMENGEGATQVYKRCSLCQKSNPLKLTCILLG